MSSWPGFLAWIEASALGHALRDSGVWTYGILNLVHILGIATLFGSILVLDLRLMGWQRQFALASVASITTPLAATGFCVAALSGLCMLSVNGTEYAGNPFLPIKFVAVALGLANAIVVGRLPAWRARHQREPSAREPLALKLLGAFSLLCWLTAIGAGRMIGYW